MRTLLIDGNGKYRWKLLHCGSDMLTPSEFRVSSTSLVGGGIPLCFSIFFCSLRYCLTESRRCFGRRGGLITVEHKYTARKLNSFSSIISGGLFGVISGEVSSKEPELDNELKFGSLVYDLKEDFEGEKRFFLGVSFRKRRAGE